nr:nucleotide sugar dehydrogenase [Candidatus Sigynarchaeota archaeon]
MNVIVFGTGYVGQVTGACLASKGNHVTLVDVDPVKVKTINDGKPTIVEEGLDAIVYHAVSSEHLGAMLPGDATSILNHARVVYVAVGTPPRQDHSIDLSQVRSVASFLAKHLAFTPAPSIIVKSTVIPGTTDAIGRAIERESGKTREVDFNLGMNPEFLREGMAVRDFFEPDSIVIGGDQGAIKDLHCLYDWVRDKVTVVDNASTAEAIKYFKNALLATKIHVANMVANACEDKKVDYQLVKPHLEALDVPFFFRNGPGFGGSCFPKDVAAINHVVNSPVLSNVLTFNETQACRIIEYAKSASIGLHGSNMGVAGLAFKPGTDDVRESPGIRLIKEISGDCIVHAHDPEPLAMRNARVELATHHVIFHDTLDGLVKASDVILVMTDWPAFKSLLNVQVPVIFAHRLVEPDISNNKFVLGSPCNDNLANKPCIDAMVDEAKNMLIDTKRSFGHDFRAYLTSIGVNFDQVVDVACKDKRLSPTFLGE